MGYEGVYYEEERKEIQKMMKMNMCFEWPKDT